MEEIETVEYHWYVLGCRHLHISALLQPEFSRLFERYSRCERVLDAYEAKRHDPAFWRAQGGSKERLRLQQLYTNVRQEMERLESLKEAVLAGRRFDQEGGAGVPARIQPVPTTLVGSGALTIPQG